MKANSELAQEVHVDEVIAFILEVPEDDYRNCEENIEGKWFFPLLFL